jgi:O-antigen/teichoic acid export membrane protein
MEPIILHLTKALGIDVRYLAKNSFWVSFRNGVGMIAGFLLSVAFARLASKTTYGQYTFVLSSMYLVNFLSIPKFDFALAQAVANGADRSLLQTTRVSVMGSLLISLILFVVGKRYVYLGDPGLGHGFYWAALLVPLLLGFNTFDAFLVGKKKFDWSAKFAALGSIGTAAGLITALWLHAQVAYLVAVFVIVNGVLTGMFWWKTRTLMKNNRTDPEVVGYGIYLTGLALMTMVAGKLGNVLLGHLKGAEVLAIYAVAITIPKAAQNVLQNFVDVVKMKLAGKSRAEMVEAKKKHGWKLIILGLVIAAGLWTILPVLMPIIFSHKYDDSIRYAQVASLGLVFFPICTFLGNLLLFEKKRKIIGISSLLSSGLNILLLPVAVYFGGIWGVVWANIIFWIYSLVFNLWAFGRERDL